MIHPRLALCVGLWGLLVRYCEQLLRRLRGALGR